MVTIKCSESGIEFEAKTKRTKQHPLIAQLKADANKKGNYRDVNNALAQVRKAGGYTTIEEFMSLIEANLQALRDADNARAIKAKALRIKEEEADEKRKVEREARNAKLKANGYIWRREAIGTEDAHGTFGSYGAGVGELSHYEWFLFSPEGNIVTVERAMEEIERGAETVKQEEIEAEKEAQRIKSEKEAQKQAEEKKFNRRKKMAESKQEVEAIAYELCKDFETVAFYRSSAMTTHEVKEGWINGVKCYIVSTYGDMDYSHYYSDYAGKAGLNPVETKSSNFADIFGDEDYF